VVAGEARTTEETTRSAIHGLTTEISLTLARESNRDPPLASKPSGSNLVF
jgi:hypothetical protein